MGAGKTAELCKRVWSCVVVFCCFVQSCSVQCAPAQFKACNQESSTHDHTKMFCSVVSCSVRCASGLSGLLSRGVVGDLLRWKGFIVFTRMAYAVYLTQFPIFFYNVGTTRHSHYYRPYMLFEMGEVTCILIAAVGMTLLFDLPAQEIKKTFWRRQTKHVDVSSDESNLYRKWSSRG
uniref:Uncharacterized protein n=1 Tax=Timema genevievae TaxID=629358 RepID=A0A7R9PH69_TIMGE|nr:unnamed protein product [Timema genevievae]